MEMERKQTQKLLSFVGAQEYVDLFMNYPPPPTPLLLLLLLLLLLQRGEKSHQHHLNGISLIYIE
jgi:hypothetical protein